MRGVHFLGMDAQVGWEGMPTFLVLDDQIGVLGVQIVLGSTWFGLHRLGCSRGGGGNLLGFGRGRVQKTGIGGGFLTKRTCKTWWGFRQITHKQNLWINVGPINDAYGSTDLLGNQHPKECSPAKFWVYAPTAQAAPGREKYAHVPLLRAAGGSKNRAAKVWAFQKAAAGRVLREYAQILLRNLAVKTTKERKKGVKIRACATFMRDMGRSHVKTTGGVLRGNSRLRVGTTLFGHSHPWYPAPDTPKTDRRFLWKKLRGPWFRNTRPYPLDSCGKNSVVPFSGIPDPTRREIPEKLSQKRDA